MAVADRLEKQAQTFEQLAASNAERAELTHDREQIASAWAFTIVAVTLRAILSVLQAEEAEDLAA